MERLLHLRLKEVVENALKKEGFST